MKICSGIVTYNPDIEALKKNVNAIMDQVDRIYIADNHSQNLRKITDTFRQAEKIRLIELNKNYGIAYAFNRIFDQAKDLYEWVLTLDQDSLCSKNMVSEYTRSPLEDSVAIVCPKIENRGVDSQQKRPCEFEYIKRTYSSGSMTRVAAWQAVGGFDEWMFIDWVDYDFCKRLTLRGYRILRVNQAILTQTLGKPEVIHAFGKKITVFNHNATRNYYLSRNMVYYARKYRSTTSLRKHFSQLARWEWNKIAFEKSKIGTVHSMMRGIRDGLSVRITSPSEDSRTQDAPVCPGDQLK